MAEAATASSKSSSAAGDSSSETTVNIPRVRQKFDWYQTETTIVITLLVKNVKAEHLSVDAGAKSLSIAIKQPSGTDYTLELVLAHEIDHTKVEKKIYSTKVEVKLYKKEGRQWSKLEDDGSADQEPKQFGPEKKGQMYPSSSMIKHDWDRIVSDIAREEKDEKAEGDAALQQLFQQIYSDGSDETRRAMNKSFIESGGTVLSTNWKEISSKTTEVKPPDGMEHKKWEY